jgi:hypothetical protein
MNKALRHPKGCSTGRRRDQQNQNTITINASIQNNKAEHTYQTRTNSSQKAQSFEYLRQGHVLPKTAHQRIKNYAPNNMQGSVETLMFFNKRGNVRIM